MIDKGLQKVFWFFVKKYKNIAWAPCGRDSQTQETHFKLYRIDIL
jgi:hypothetical protein